MDTSVSGELRLEVGGREVVACNKAKGMTEDWAVWEVYIYIYIYIYIYTPHNLGRGLSGGCQWIFTL